MSKIGRLLYLAIGRCFNHGAPAGVDKGMVPDFIRTCQQSAPQFNVGVSSVRNQRGNGLKSQHALASPPAHSPGRTTLRLLHNAKAASKGNILRSFDEAPSLRSSPPLFYFPSLRFGGQNV